MSAAEATSFQEAPLLFHRQKEVLDSLKRGEISDVRVSQSYAADKIVGFGLKEGFLQQGLKRFPDPRKHVEVPIEVLLLPQILQRLHDEHSLLLAPYMLNDADLITRLGYNARVLDEGFNNRAKSPRETAFHGETLKHVLRGFRSPSRLLDWFNQSWLPLWRAAAPGRTRQYILDGMKIETPSPKKRKREGSGVVSDNDGNVTHGYKVIWLQEIIDRKGVLVALKVVPINVHDMEASRSLVDEFPFERDALLIVDRAFVDGPWITRLKQERGVDVCLPLKKNMEIVTSSTALADERGLWKPHPTRENQTCAELSGPDLFWNDCPVLQSGVLSRWNNKKTGEQETVLFVTTQAGKNAKAILAVYDQRAEIEESHRELKCFQGIETLTSGKLVHVVFRILMNVISFNLLRLFLNSEECDSVEDFTAKTLRQRRRQEPNPKIIIYTTDAFATIYFLDLLSLLLTLKRSVQKKLSTFFSALRKQTHPNSS